MNFLKLVYLLAGLILTSFASSMTAHPIGMPVLCLGAICALVLCLRTKNKPVVTTTPSSDEFTVALNRSLGFEAPVPNSMAEIVPFEVPSKPEPRFDVHFESFNYYGPKEPTAKVELKNLTPDEVIAGFAPTPIIFRRRELKNIPSHGIVRQFETPKAGFTSRGRRYRDGTYLNKITIRPALAAAA